MRKEEIMNKIQDVRGLIDYSLDFNKPLSDQELKGIADSLFKCYLQIRCNLQNKRNAR